MITYDSNIFGSNREFDRNGFLKVEANNITKTQVAPYLGKEIPNWKGFNLEPDKIYYVLRPEEELKKAAKTFNNLPLTRKHIEVDVDNVPKEDIIGSMGDKAEYTSPYITNSLIVYDKKEIDKILSGKKKELSCGYTYTPIPESGEFEGKHYDFKMTDIVGNHVALVKEGRAGHDVMVADEKPDIVMDYDPKQKRGYHGRWATEEDYIKNALESALKFNFPKQETESDKERKRQFTISVEKLIQEVKNGNLRKDDVKFGKAKDWLVELSKKFNLNIQNHRHVVNKDGLIHIEKNHKNEKWPGQADIKDDDIENIPDIVNYPDFMIFGKKTDRGLPGIGYLKLYDDNTIHYVEEVQNRNKELVSKTIYKVVGRDNAQKMVSALLHTSTTGPATATLVPVHNIIINQNEKNVKEKK